MQFEGKIPLHNVQASEHQAVQSVREGFNPHSEEEFVTVRKGNFYHGAAPHIPCPVNHLRSVE
jgi:hypothetical protein